MNWLDGLPPWAKVVGVIGVPAFFSLWLMYVVTITLPAMVAASTANAAAIASFRERITEHERDTLRVIPLLEKICRRLGRNDFEREACQ